MMDGDVLVDLSGSPQPRVEHLPGEVGEQRGGPLRDDDHPVEDGHSRSRQLLSEAMKERGLVPRVSPADAGGVLTSTTKEAPHVRVRRESVRRY